MNTSRRGSAPTPKPMATPRVGDAVTSVAGGPGAAAVAGRSAWDDVNDYADAETEVVLDILARTRAWRAGAIEPRPVS